MSGRKIAVELEQDKVLDHTLLALTVIVSNSESCMEIGEISEIDLHMAGELCGGILDPWPNSSDEVIFEEYFCIFPDLASRDIHHLGNSFFFEYITHIHRECSDELEKVSFFFFEQFLIHNSYFLIK